MHEHDPSSCGTADRRKQSWVHRYDRISVICTYDTGRWSRFESFLFACNVVIDLQLRFVADQASNSPVRVGRRDRCLSRWVPYNDRFLPSYCRVAGHLACGSAISLPLFRPALTMVISNEYIVVSRLFRQGCTSYDTSGETIRQATTGTNESGVDSHDFSSGEGRCQGLIESEWAAA